MVARIVPVTDVWTGFEAMTAEQCRRLLASTHIGRIALTVGALPVVLPVQYALDGDHLLVRTPGHHTVGRGVDGQVVGFEADRLDLDQGTGWCVSVTGALHVVDHPEELGAVHRWFSDGTLLSLDTDVIVGHRIVV